MNEWKTYKLTELCNTISETYKGHAKDIVLINTSDVLEGKCLNHTKEPNKNLKGQFKKTFRQHDILYSEIRPANKRFAYINFDATDYIASTKLMVLRHNDIIEPLYLYYVLQSQRVIDELQMLAESRSGTFPQITYSELSKIDVKLPDKNIQKRILDILSSIDNKIETNRLINDNLDQQAQALYKQWFVDNCSEEWEEKSLGEIINIYDSLRRPLSGHQRDKMEKIYPYYGAASLMDYVDNYLFDGVYLLLGEDGTVVDNLGYPILQYVWGKFWVNNHAHILTGAHGYSTETLYMLLKQTSVKSIVTGAVQPKISQANLKSIQIVTPPIDLLDKFNKLITPLFDNIRNNIEQNHRLTTLRDTLLPKLMSGELSVEDVSVD